uniref:Solute carrier family 16 member 7 n=1 Tax=Xiphophorus maculatus TaxID=8083 RepID=M4APM0_XIPMA
MPPAAATNLGYTPPDGGWGWTVVFAAFISIGFSYAFPKSLTIYFKEIQEYVSVSYSEIAWVSSVILASMYAGGQQQPEATFTKIQQSLIKFVSRPVVMVDGLMVCRFFFLSKGFGLVFNLQSALTIIGTYFQVKKPLANGLAMVEGPVVLSTLAPLNQFLLYSFGWRGSFLVLGSIVLNCCVAVSRRKTSEEAAAVDIGSFSANPPVKGSKNKKKSQSFVSRYIDISLFTHRGFLIYLIGNVFMFFDSFVPAVFLAPYAKYQRTDEYSALLLLPIFALVDMFSRPVTGFLANSRWIRPRIQSFSSFAVSYNGVCHLLCPLASGYGCLFLMDLVGAHRFPSAVGLVTIIKCGPVLLGPHISGALVDVFKDYKYMQNSIILSDRPTQNRANMLSFEKKMIHNLHLDSYVGWGMSQNIMF